MSQREALAKGAPVLGLVGKGITFDTGGISIKPADGMEKMKYDMAGAAAMIGAMHAIARLKPAVKVIGGGLLGGEHAGRTGVQAGRCGDGDVGHDHRDRQHGRRRQAGAGRWAALCQDTGLHPPDRRGHADRRLRGGAGHAECRALLQRRSNLRKVCAGTGCLRREASGGFPAPTTIASTSRARLPTS